MYLKNIIDVLHAEKVICSFVDYENIKPKWEQLEFMRGSIEEQNFINSQNWEVLRIDPIDDKTLKIYLY